MAIPSRRPIVACHPSARIRSLHNSLRHPPPHNDGRGTCARAVLRPGRGRQSIRANERPCSASRVRSNLAFHRWGLDDKEFSRDSCPPDGESSVAYRTWLPHPRDTPAGIGSLLISFPSVLSIRSDAT
jgi:hypothetical protein